MSASQEEPPPGEGRPRREPNALELVRWSATMIGVSLLIAAIAIPLLRWLGFSD